MGDEFLSMVSGDPLGRKIRDSVGGFGDGPAENAIAASRPASPDKKGPKTKPTDTKVFSIRKKRARVMIIPTTAIVKYCL